METPNITASRLSSRGQHLSNDGSIIRTHFDSVWAKNYSEELPSGVINLGTSDNYIMGDYVADFINKNVQFSAKDMDYGSGPWGSVRLRNAMAQFLKTWFQPVRDISPDEIMFSCGCTALCENLGFSLFEPGEGLLLGMPIYHSFQRDFGLRAQVKPIFVSCKDNVDEFGAERVRQYEEAIGDAKEQGTTVRALLIGNPHNPLGRCYTPEALVAYLELCQKHNIHLIVDEIYALSIYGSLTDEEAVPFKSILSFDTDKYIDKDLLHVLYGFSKDFALAGLRLGCLWTRNTDLLAAMSGMSIISYPSTVSDKIASVVLESEDWFKAYVEKNQSTLRECAKVATGLLKHHRIPYISGSYAGFYLLLDLRGYIRDKAPENVTWADEKDLKRVFEAHSIYLTSGQGLSCEKPCFMRFCFVKEEAEILLGVERLRTALDLLKSGAHAKNLAVR